MLFYRRQKYLQTHNRQLGASLVEYGLLVAMISVMALAGVRQTGTSLNCVFSKVSGHLQGLEEQAIVCASELAGSQPSTNPNSATGPANGGGTGLNNGGPLETVPGVLPVNGGGPAFIQVPNG